MSQKSPVSSSAGTSTLATINTPKMNGDSGSSFSDSLLMAMLAFRDGDFSIRMPRNLSGVEGKIADSFNEIVTFSDRRAKETVRVSLAVGKEGKLKQRMNVPEGVGGWADEVAAINLLIDDLVWPTTEVTRAIGAVAKGDLGQSMGLEVDGRPLEGEFLRSAKLVNKMIDQLSVFTSEVTRVAREVGTEGKLGGQAQVKGVSGVWKDLTESVNQMAGNLTAQVRNIADVTIAVANGDCRKRSPSTCAVKFFSSRKPPTPWWTSCDRLPPKSLASPAKWERKANSAARPWCPVWLEPGRILPTRSTPWPAT